MSDSKAELARREAEREQAEAPPPDYVWRLPTPRAQPPSIPRTNHVNIAHEHPQARGTFVIDPALEVPAALLAPPKDGEEEADQPNLRMSSYYAGVEADVWVLDSDAVERTRLVFDAEHGRVKIRLRSLGNRPCRVDIRAGHAKVDIMLPRHFMGSLTAKTTHATASVPPRFTKLAEADGEERYYLGDVARAESIEAHIVTVTAPHGKITITFEGDGPAEKAKGTWFSSS
ncbi:hypothetical protein AURDEDRAFT_170474 [Auricularia subglabra TFB-10046 SS5]|nr:hypothetical protein AURDEDRAFT_170474 [Auricularia subglabra TFB-10046 SS5]